MAFTTKYRIEFDTVKDRYVKIDIEEDGFAGTVTDLIGTSSPVEINYSNAEFDKLAGIRESKIRIRILSSNVQADDFLTTSDKQYKVKIYVNNTVEWVGWLDNDYLKQPFLDTPEEIELSASDGLSLIKSIPLADLSGNQFWGINRVKNFIAFALDKTGLGLDFWSFINMYPPTVDQRDTDDDFDAFYYSYITSFTFLEGPRDYNDCYTVLSKIMEAYGCTLFQARGAWYIVQTNDRIAGRLDGTQRSATGAALDIATDADFSFNIGLEETVKLINADALVSWEKAFKESVINYRFLKPPIFFRNWDLLDGDFNAPLSSSTRIVNEIENWENTDNTSSVSDDCYVGAEIDSTTGAELVRYLLFYVDTTFDNDPGKKTTDYYVNKEDRISFSYAIREKNSGFATSNQFCFVVLNVGGGNFYTLDNNGEWNYNVWQRVGINWGSAEDRRFWKSFSISSDPFPENGALSIEFTAVGHSRTASNEVRFKDLSVSIETYFNEMVNVDGYEYKQSQTPELKNKFDNQLFISNSDNIGTQGAILNSDYSKLENWKYYSASDGTAVRFAKYISRAVWRSLYRNFQRIEGRLYDLYPASRLLSPLNTVRFTAVDDKEFLITTLALDLANESAEFTMVEIRGTASTDDFTETGTEFFRYLNVRQESNDKIYEEKKPIDLKYGLLAVIYQVLVRGKRRRFNNYS